MYFIKAPLYLYNTPMIYLDHAATTPTDPRVIEAMEQHSRENWGNPSSPHRKGREARKAIDESREAIASYLTVKPQEVIFVSCGSEGNTLGLRGLCERHQRETGNTGTIITSAVEHSCTLQATHQLEHRGWNIVEVPVDANAQIAVADIEAALTDDTLVVSVQWANNEVGTIQPIEDIALLCREKDIAFHCDAVQGVGLLPFPDALPDFFTIAAHKFYGPKGIGALIIRDHLQIDPLITGGGQEFGMRAGTENLPAIVGMAKALELAFADLRSGTPEKIALLRDHFEQQLSALPDVSINARSGNRLPNFSSVHFQGHSADTLVAKLDMQGICCSAGAACAAGAAESSHVLQAMGQSRETAKRNVRFSLGKGTTKDDLSKTSAVLTDLVG